MRIEFDVDIKLPWYICSNGHVTPLEGDTNE